MALASNEVIVYEADGEYRVFPPVIRLDAKNGNNPDKLVVTNATDDELVLYATGDVFDNGNTPNNTPKPTTEAIAAFDSLTTKGVRSNGNGKKKVFSYQVVVPKSGKKAKGSSDPKIVIEN